MTEFSNSIKDSSYCYRFRVITILSTCYKLPIFLAVPISCANVFPSK